MIEVCGRAARLAGTGQSRGSNRRGATNRVLGRRAEGASQHVLGSSHALAKISQTHTRGEPKHPGRSLERKVGLG
jgi:hypothetical protein